MNTVQILGNLTKDAEVRYTKSGKAVATFTVAASNTYVTPDGETKEQTAFVNCVAWGKQGSLIRGRANKANKWDNSQKALSALLRGDYRLGHTKHKMVKRNM